MVLVPAPQPATNNSTDFTQPALPVSVLHYPICCVDTQIITKDHINNTRGQAERLRELNDIKTRTGANYLGLEMPYDDVTVFTNWVNDARLIFKNLNFRCSWNAWEGTNGVGNIATSTSLTSIGTTATCVTQTPHGLNTGDTVSMNGMNQTNYRGEFVCTVVNSTTFTYTMLGTAASPATASGGGIGWRWGRQTLLDHTYDFWTTNQALLQPGDMVAFNVESQQATSNGNMCFFTQGTTTFDYSLYNAFQINLVRYANYCFAQIPRLSGKIHTWAISHGLSNVNLNGQTVNTGGSVSTGNASGLSNSDMATYFFNRFSFDHYIDSSVITGAAYKAQYALDIAALIAAFPCVETAGGGLYPAEWGFHTSTDYGDQVQNDVYTGVKEVLASHPEIIGINFWNHLGQLSSSLWTDISGTVVLGGRQAVGAVQSTFVLLPSAQTYVTTKGTQFYLNGKPWLLAGCTMYPNLYYWNSSSMPAALDAVVAAGLNTVRFTNFTNIAGDNAYNVSHNLLKDENAYSYLDSVLNLCRQRNLKVIFETSQVSSFSTDPTTGYGYAFGSANDLAMWQDYVNFVTNRVNTVNGLQYKNDDTICMWSIAGELGEPAGEDVGLGPFMSAVAGYFKAADPNHLVCPGGMNPEQIYDSSFPDNETYNSADILSYANIDCAGTEGYYGEANEARVYPPLGQYAVKRNKPWFIIEFGFNQGASYFETFSDNQRAKAMKFVLELGLQTGYAGFVVFNFDMGVGAGFGVNLQTPAAYQMTKIFAKTPQYFPRAVII